MFDIKTLLILIPALPLAAAILTAVLGRRVLRERSHWPTVAALLLSFVASIVLVFQVQKQIERPAENYRPAAVTLWSWYNIPDAMPKPAGGGTLPSGWGDFHIDIALQADPLTAVMLAVVTCISSLVAIYSIGYMHGDRRLLAVLRLREPVRLLDDPVGLGRAISSCFTSAGSWSACAAIC